MVLDVVVPSSSTVLPVSSSAPLMYVVGGMRPVKEEAVILPVAMIVMGAYFMYDTIGPWSKSNLEFHFCYLILHLESLPIFLLDQVVCWPV